MRAERRILLGHRGNAARQVREAALCGIAARDARAEPTAETARAHDGHLLPKLSIKVGSKTTNLDGLLREAATTHE
jgi:hypothetical protein